MYPVFEYVFKELFCLVVSLTVGTLYRDEVLPQCLIIFVSLDTLPTWNYQVITTNKPYLFKADFLSLSLGKYTGWLSHISWYTLSAYAPQQATVISTSITFFLLHVIISAVITDRMWEISARYYSDYSKSWSGAIKTPRQVPYPLYVSIIHIFVDRDESSSIWKDPYDTNKGSPFSI